MDFGLDFGLDFGFGFGFGFGLDFDFGFGFGFGIGHDRCSGFGEMIEVAREILGGGQLDRLQTRMDRRQIGVLGLVSHRIQRLRRVTRTHCVGQRGIGQFGVEIGRQVIGAGQLHGDQCILVVSLRGRMIRRDHAQSVGLEFGLLHVGPGDIVGGGQDGRSIVRRGGFVGFVSLFGLLRSVSLFGLLRSVSLSGLRPFGVQRVVEQVQIVLDQGRPARFGQGIRQGD